MLARPAVWCGRGAGITRAGAEAHQIARLTRLALLVSLALAAFTPLARANNGAPPCPPGQSPDPSGLVCVFVDKTSTSLDAATMSPGQQDQWLTSALEGQHRLGDNLPLRDAMWVGTHNSFNTVSNTVPSPSNLDSNQHLSLVEQLSIGVRSIEVDVHWTPSARARGAKAPVVCHGRPPSELNAGCTYERLLTAELSPVAQWLRQNKNDVILLYLEDHLDDPAGFAAATDAIKQTIGPYVYKPAAGQACPLLPLSLRRADVLAAHKQVVIMSGCGTGSWNSTVFDDSVRSEEGNPEFAGFPACTSPSVKRADYGTKLVRFYEDSTFVSAAVGGGDPGHRLTTDTITAMVRCGVNLFGLDQVDPNDPRLEAMVWSWARNEPSLPSGCAIDGADQRFHTVPCGLQLHFACLDASGAWFVSAATGGQTEGAAACGDASFAIPESGAQAERLRQAKTAAGVDAVWLAFY